MGCCAIATAKTATDPAKAKSFIWISLTFWVAVSFVKAASIAFYEALGAQLIVGSRDGDWAQLRVGGAEIGLLAHPANPEQGKGDIELCFEYSDALSRLEQKLSDSGVTIVRGAADEAFGEQLQIEAPGGMLIKINKLDAETFV